MGVSVVNALSSFLEVDIFTGGQSYHQTYERGKKTSELIIPAKPAKPVPKSGLFRTVIFLKLPYLLMIFW